jgi:hypothetical protein
MSTNLDLTSYTAVQQATFIRLVFNEAGEDVVVRISTHSTPFSITERDGISYSYPAVGTLMNVSSLTNEIKSSQSDVVITLSGIPSQYMTDIISNPIKGASVEIRRVFFNATTGQVLNITGNPVLEFVGVVNNFNMDEGYSQMDSQTITTTISLSCASILSLLMKKVSGRRTNQGDQNYWFPGDLSMNRVAVISNASFDFGGKTPAAATIAPTGTTMTGTAG